MTFASVCTGIGGFDLGFIQAGHTALWFCENDKPCQAALKHQFPTIPCYDDLTDLPANLPRPDLFAGGTPCQGFSFASQRQSLEDVRSNLCLAFCDLCDRLNPAIIVWENVPGVLNTKDNAFGCFLARLVGADAPLLSPLKRGRWTRAGLVAGPKRNAAWRVLDSQYFGLAQRRQRVFVVCDTGTGRAEEILFERESLPRNTPPQAGQRVAPTVEGRAGRSGENGVQHLRRLCETAPTLPARKSGGGGLGTDFDCDGGLIARPLRARSNHSHREDSDNVVTVATIIAFPKNLSSTQCAKTENLSPALASDNPTAVVMAHGQGNAEICSDGSPSLNCNHEAPIAFQPRIARNGRGNLGDAVNALNGAGAPTMQQGYAVRRLMPVECARLQGFHDDWLIGSDSQQYKQLGNAVSVPVAKWIAQRIAKFYS